MGLDGKRIFAPIDFISHDWDTRIIKLADAYNNTNITMLEIHMCHVKWDDHSRVEMFCNEQFENVNWSIVFKFGPDCEDLDKKV
jgi:hypothetical protein